METYAIQQRLTLAAGLSTAALYVAYSIFVVFFTEEWPADHLDRLYQLVIVLLSVIYLERENRRFHYLYHPHEFGMFIWFFWPLIVPYYLVKTRGAVGIFVFLGLIALLIVQFLVILIWKALPI